MGTSRAELLLKFQMQKSFTSENFPKKLFCLIIFLICNFNDLQQEEIFSARGKTGETKADFKDFLAVDPSGV